MPNIETGRDPFAFTRAEDNGDARVLALFNDWLDASRASDRHKDDCEGPEYKAALNRFDEAERAVSATPGGPAALAIKTYFLLRQDTLNHWAPDNAVLRCPELFEDDELDDWHAEMIRSIFRDAAKQAPVLAELVAPIIHDDAALIDADIQVSWCRSCIADPAPTPRTGNRRFDRQILEGHEQRISEVRSQLAKALTKIANAEALTPRGAAIKLQHSNCTAEDQAQKTELRARAEALIAEFGGPLPDGDAGLIEAERRLREIRQQDKSLYHDFGEISVQIESEIIIGMVDPVRDRLREFIEVTPPTGLAGLGVKLRLLTDPSIGILTGDEPSEGDITCLKQVAEFVETAAQQAGS
jgi:hypothetical protein